MTNHQHAYYFYLRFCELVLVVLSIVLVAHGGGLCCSHNGTNTTNGTILGSKICDPDTLDNLWRNYLTIATWHRENYQLPGRNIIRLKYGVVLVQLFLLGFCAMLVRDAIRKNGDRRRHKLKLVVAMVGAVLACIFVGSAEIYFGMFYKLGLTHAPLIIIYSISDSFSAACLFIVGTILGIEICLQTKSKKVVQKPVISHLSGSRYVAPEIASNSDFKLRLSADYTLTYGQSLKKTAEKRNSLIRTFTSPLIAVNSSMQSKKRNSVKKNGETVFQNEADVPPDSKLITISHVY